MHSRSKYRSKGAKPSLLVSLLIVILLVVIGVLTSERQSAAPSSGGGTGGSSGGGTSSQSEHHTDGAHDTNETGDVALTATSTIFESAIDGDTIRTTAGKVRLIGIDTPESGECGYEAATDLVRAHLVRGDQITLLLPEGQNEQDNYGRLIRYVETSDGSDLGLLQLQAGNAIGRYDSIDGYPSHPRERDYRAAQTATMGPGKSVHTVACTAG